MKKITTWLLTFVLLISTITTLGAKDKDKEIDDLVAQVLSEAKVPGISIAVTSQDQILFAKGYGVTAQGSETPMTENTVSGIGSLTKSFTALAMLQQVEKGNVKLEDPVIKYLPEFRTFDKEKSDQITLGMLLNNATGLPHNADLSIWEKNDSETDYFKMLKQFENVTLAFDPGTSYSYSNDGFMLAGMILEKVTGKKYEEVIEENILKPLEMFESTTDLAKINELGGLYGHLAAIDGYKPARESHLGIMLPAGSEFRSSVVDLSHYAQMMLQEGKYKNKTILSEATFKQYETKGVTPFEMFDYQLLYGSGWIHLKDSPYVFHMGQTLAMSSILVMDTESKLAVSVLYNVSDVLNKDYSPFSLAFKILSLYNGKDLSGIKMTGEPVLKTGTTFLEDDLSLEGQYQSETGLLKLTVLDENGLKGQLTNEQGTSEFVMQVLSDAKVYIKNVASEGLMGVLRGTNNEVVALVHPMFGILERVITTPLTGYKSFIGQGYSLQVFEAMDQLILGEGTGFQLEKAGIQLEFVKAEWTEDFFTLPEQLELLDQSSLRESVIGGKNCIEQILVYQDGEELMAYIQISIEGNLKYTLVGSMPFEQLSEVRSTQILEMIKSLLED